MCRIAAYIGPPINLKTLLLDPAHSLYEQSWAPQELRYATLNADGYGVAWFGDDDTPARYTSDLAIWNDHNLPHLARSLRSPVWLCNVRSATPGNAHHAINAQPYADAGSLFTHNGYLGGFPGQTRRALLDALSDEAHDAIAGTTDSEYLYALIRSTAGETLSTQLAAALARLADMTGDTASLLNIAMADAEQLVVARHAISGDCPSLYVAHDHADFPGAWLVASERFDDDPAWQTVAPHSLLTLRPSQPAQHARL
ncbi:class II glutamine amidotransferase [bacterium]|nr:class II glutamine amidotransferase [bacterium]